MRELLFRGQQRKKGEKVRLDGSPVESSWFYGNGIFQSKGDFSIIYQSEPEFSKHSVYSDTLGQYTGLTDKNGTKIFEGDIVVYHTSTNRATNREFHEVVFETRGESGYFGIKISNIETWRFCLEVPAKLMEVIGNIYDNPELLEFTEEANNG